MKFAALEKAQNKKKKKKLNVVVSSTNPYFSFGFDYLKLFSLSLYVVLTEHHIDFNNNKLELIKLFGLPRD